MENLYEQMLNTAQNCGINIINTNHAAQLIAVVYLYGDESAVYSGKMRSDIKHIAMQYGIAGGCVPDEDFIAKVKKYASDIKRGLRPTWLSELEMRYNIQLPDYEEYAPPRRME